MFPNAELFSRQPNPNSTQPYAKRLQTYYDAINGAALHSSALASNASATSAMQPVPSTASTGGLKLPTYVIGIVVPLVVLAAICLAVLLVYLRKRSLARDQEIQHLQRCISSPWEEPPQSQVSRPV